MEHLDPTVICSGARAGRPSPDVARVPEAHDSHAGIRVSVDTSPRSWVAERIRSGPVEINQPPSGWRRSLVAVAYNDAPAARVGQQIERLEGPEVVESDSGL